MNIKLHIEEMVLDGLPVCGPEAPNVQAAFQAELARLLAAGFVAPQTSSVLGSLAGGEIGISPGITAHELGGEIGRSVFKTVASPGFERNAGAQNNTKGK